MSTRYGILGEHDSDVATLKVLVKRISGNQTVAIRGMAFGGCSRMLRKGARQIALFAELKCNRFVICHDADGPDPEPIRNKVQEAIADASGYAEQSFIVVPVQELEAWILADIEAVTNIMQSWRPKPIKSPEAIRSPKEHLERLSRTDNGKPRYDHATHNERVAAYLDLNSISQKCPSFRGFRDFVKSPKGGKA